MVSVTLRQYRMLESLETTQHLPWLEKVVTIGGEVAAQMGLVIAYMDRYNWDRRTARRQVCIKTRCRLCNKERTLSRQTLPRPTFKVITLMQWLSTTIITLTITMCEATWLITHIAAVVRINSIWVGRLKNRNSRAESPSSTLISNTANQGTWLHKEQVLAPR